jgi:hypothetical protein
VAPTSGRIGTSPTLFGGHPIDIHRPVSTIVRSWGRHPAARRPRCKLGHEAESSSESDLNPPPVQNQRKPRES